LYGCVCVVCALGLVCVMGLVETVLQSY